MLLAAASGAGMGMAQRGGCQFWGAAAELSLGSINSGSLVHVCTFPPPIKGKGRSFCSGNVPICLKLQAGQAVYEAVNMLGKMRTALIVKAGKVHVMLTAFLFLSWTDLD